MTVTYIISWSERGTVGPEVAGSIPAKNSKHRELTSTFEHIELPATLVDYFLRSNKSNVNQRCLVRQDFCQKSSGFCSKIIGQNFAKNQFCQKSSGFLFKNHLAKFFVRDP